MEIHQYISFKLVAFSLPLFCIFLSWSWGAADSIPIPFTAVSPPPPTSAALAANVLRKRGYFLFSSALLSLSTTATNFSGTLLAPPDFAFSFATAKFLNHRTLPPRPSTILVLYHTLKPPAVLTWAGLSSRPNGDELRTFYNNNCVFLFKNSFSGGEISISSSSSGNLFSAVKIRQPDMYVDEHLTVHGIDGVLDPTLATKCSFPDVDPMNRIQPNRVNRSFLDNAIRALRWRGFSVVATAMAIKRQELLYLSSVTVFAVSDKNLFSRPGGFHYDFRHHAVPERQHYADLANLPAGGKEFDTLVPNKTVSVHPTDGGVTVDGVVIDGTEVYHNRWIVVVSIMISLDDASGYYHATTPVPVSGLWVPSPAPLSAEAPDSKVSPVASPATLSPADTPFSKTPSPAPLFDDSTGSQSTRVPSPAPQLAGGDTISKMSSPALSPQLAGGDTLSKMSSPALLFDDSTGSQSTGIPSAAADLAANGSVGSPAPGPARYDASDLHCHEGADLLCLINNARKLEQVDGADEIPDNVARSDPSISMKESAIVKLAENNVNIVDDLFYYT